VFTQKRFLKYFLETVNGLLHFNGFSLVVYRHWVERNARREYQAEEALQTNGTLERKDSALSELNCAKANITTKVWFDVLECKPHNINYKL
jgi:hypothetical protein